MFSDSVDSTDSVLLFKLLWAVCDSDDDGLEEVIGSMGGDTERLGRLVSVLEVNGYVDCGMYPTVAGIEAWVRIPIRFVNTIRMRNGTFLSGAVVRGAGGSENQSFLDRMGCIGGRLSSEGPTVSGSGDPDVVRNSIWMMGYSRMGSDDAMVMFVADDAVEAVDRCLNSALKIASRIRWHPVVNSAVIGCVRSISTIGSTYALMNPRYCDGPTSGRLKRGSVQATAFVDWVKDS